MRTFSVCEQLKDAVLFPLFDEQKEPRWNFQLDEDGHPTDWVGEEDDPEKEHHKGWSKWQWGLDEDKFTPKMKRRKLTGYGVNMGESGLFGVDIDVKGEDGFAHWSNFVNGRELPPTLTIETGTGGQHHYYRAPEGKRYGHTASIIAPAVDTRSATSYLVGPGSKVKHKSYTVVTAHTIAPMPGWLEKHFDALEEERESRKLPPLDPSLYVHVSGDFPFTWSEKVLRDAVDGVTNATSHSHAIFTGAIRCARAGIPLHLVEERLFQALPRGKQNSPARASIKNGYERGHRELQEDFATGKRWLPGEAPAKGYNRQPVSVKKPKESVAEVSEAASVTEEAADGVTNEAAGAPDWDRFDPANYEHTYICRRLTEQFMGKYLYVEEAKSFLRYDETRGVSNQIPDSTMSNAIRDILEQEYRESIAAIDEARLKSDADRTLRAAARRLLNANTIANSIIGVRGDLSTPIARLNRTQGLVVAANGVVDMRAKTESGKLTVSPFSQSYLETRCSPGNYLPEKYVLRDPKTWDEKVASLLGAVDKSTRYWLLEQMGKAMSGTYAKMDFITFMSGRAGAGKSSILAAFRQMAGTYAGKVDRKAFRNTSGTNFSLAAYEYLRLAFVEELPENYLNVDSVKDLVNASLLTIEKKFQDPRDIPMEAHTFITANILPRIAQNDDGLWRRIRAMEFNTIHVESEEELKRLRGEQKKKIDTYNEQVKKLRKGEEAPPPPEIQRYTLANGDLADSSIHLLPQEFWDCLLTITLTAGGEWFARDRVGVKTPEAVVQYTEDWRAGTDRILGWLDECVEFDPASTSLRTDAYQCFVEWLGDNGASDWGASKFYQAVEGHKKFLEANVYYRKGRTTAAVQHCPWTPRRKNRFDKPIARSGDGIQHRYYGIRLKKAALLQDFSEED